MDLLALEGPGKPGGVAGGRVGHPATDTSARGVVSSLFPSCSLACMVNKGHALVKYNYCLCASESKTIQPYGESIDDTYML